MKSRKRKSFSSNYKKALSRLSSLAALTLLCTGCHYDSNEDVDEFREKSLQEDLAVIYEGLPEFSAPLTLEDIFCIAAERNLNILVKALEYDIQKELVTREKFGMLPDIKTHFESLIRNRNTASSSESLVPGVPPAPLSISSQKHQWRWDYALVWNYVDFGLAFLRSRQEYNRALKVQFEYKRLQQNLIVDITRQYWKALTAKLARKKSKIILEKTKVQQAAVKKQLEAKIISEIQGLRNEGQLITFQAQFQYYDKEYHTAMAELGLLMGLTPCVEFELADVIAYNADACLPDICELESTALYNRPELYADDAEELIQRDEARAAVLQMYPGVDLFAGHNHDSNRFLLFNHWIQAGTRAAYNLLDWPRHLQESRAANGRVLLAKNNRLLMSVSVMTQVHLAYNVYLDNLESFKLSRSLEDINLRLLKAAKNEQKQGKLHEADVLKYEIELLEAQIDALKQYGELNNALEQLNNAMGTPLQYVNERQYGVIEEVEQEAAKKEEAVAEEEDNVDEAEALRGIYLDYIIEKIEKAEEEALHDKVKAQEEEINKRVKEEEEKLRKSAEQDMPVDTLEPEQLDDPQDDTIPQDRHEAPKRGERKQALGSVDEVLDKYADEGKEADSPPGQINSDEVEELLQRYSSSDESDGDSEEDYTADNESGEQLQKYSLNDDLDNNSEEDNNEKTPSTTQQEGFISYSFNLLIDAVSQLFARIKSLL